MLELLIKYFTENGLVLDNEEMDTLRKVCRRDEGNAEILLNQNEGVKVAP